MTCCETVSKGYHCDGCLSTNTVAPVGWTASRAFGYDFNPLHDSLHMRFNLVQEKLEEIALESDVHTRDSLIREVRHLVQLLRKDALK